MANLSKMYNVRSKRGSRWDEDVKRADMLPPISVLYGTKDVDRVIINRNNNIKDNGDGTVTLNMSELIMRNSAPDSLEWKIFNRDDEVVLKDWWDGSETTITADINELIIVSRDTNDINNIIKVHSELPSDERDRALEFLKNTISKVQDAPDTVYTFVDIGTEIDDASALASVILG